MPTMSNNAKRKIPDSDPTLTLPRILCLHGGGTNARIFRMQCRVLEGTLRSTFRLVYAEAPFPAQPGPDVTSVYKNHGPFKAWLRITSSDATHEPSHVIERINSSIEAAMHADTQAGATGEWIALLGFSQGAKLAASILYAQQVLKQRYVGVDSAIWPNFRFAVLMAGRGPLVWLLLENYRHIASNFDICAGLVDVTTPSVGVKEPDIPVDSDAHILRIPTVHIHGLQDPGLRLHRALLNNYFDQELVRVVEWEGAHRVPLKRKDVDAVVQEIYALARATGVLGVWGL